MLIVKTHIGNAGNKGLGLFADETIKKGQVWWKCDNNFNRIVHKEQYD